MRGRTWEGGEIPSLGEIREVSTEGGLDIQNSLGLEQEGQCHTTHAPSRRRNRTHGTHLGDIPLPGSCLTQKYWSCVALCSGCCDLAVGNRDHHKGLNTVVLA